MALNEWLAARFPNLLGAFGSSALAMDLGLVAPVPQTTLGTYTGPPLTVTAMERSCSLVNGAGQIGHTLHTDGWPGNSAIPTGFRFMLAGHRTAYSVLNGTRSDGGGNAAIWIAPDLEMVTIDNERMIPFDTSGTVGLDPRIAAERLLRTVLPEDLCVSLSAINECEYRAKRYRYKIFKNKKTHCFQGGKVFSCCIELSDGTAPDTDRIIAEYLLLKNDEAQYLKTANLAQIGGQPRPGLYPWARTGTEMAAMMVQQNAVADRMAQDQLELLAEAMRLTPHPPYITGLPGDAIQVRRPARYGITPTMILQGMLSQLATLTQRRWPTIGDEDAAMWPYGRDRVAVECQWRDLDLALSSEDFRVRFIRPAAEQMARALAERPNIFAFQRYPVRGEGSAEIWNQETGIVLSLVREYDIRGGQMRNTFIADLLLR